MLLFSRNESTENLDTLHELLKHRSWIRVERKGAERTLQALVEAVTVYLKTG